jgi:hypothetical protein
VRLLDDIDETQQVAITREPEGGSDQPTMDPLGIAPVAAA